MLYRTISKLLNTLGTISLVVDDNIDNYENKDKICKCSICWDDKELNTFVKLGCSHEFCKDCIKQSLQNETRETPCCAFCRADIKFLELRLESIKNEFDNLITSEHQT